MCEKRREHEKIEMRERKAEERVAREIREAERREYVKWSRHTRFIFASWKSRLTMLTFRPRHLRHNHYLKRTLTLLLIHDLGNLRSTRTANPSKQSMYTKTGHQTGRGVPGSEGQMERPFVSRSLRYSL